MNTEKYGVKLDAIPQNPSNNNAAIRTTLLPLVSAKQPQK